MTIRNRTTNGLKGQYLIAQGNALGTEIWVISPCKGKSKDAMIRLLPLQGVHRAVLQPRAILPLWGASGMIADNHYFFLTTDFTDFTDFFDHGFYRFYGFFDHGFYRFYGFF